tara:strand:- start:404284 stop:405453 length:1170 start_codon:yes stop_codon:yes gene_type:complete
MAFTGKASYSGGNKLPDSVEDISDIIGIVSPFETPLLDHLGDPKRCATSTIHEWIEDSLLPNSGRISEAQRAFGPDAVGANEIFVVNAEVFRKGDLVRPAKTGEVMLVTHVSVAEGTILVGRGYGATTKASLEIGMDLHILGNAAMEGDDNVEGARFSNRSRKINFTQIFTAGVEVAGSLQASRAYGISDEVDYQKQERMRELLRDLENCVINGVAPTRDQTNLQTVRRSMAGIVSTIRTNVFEPGVDGIPDGPELSDSILNEALKRIHDQSPGGVDTIVVGGAQKRKINAFANGSRAYLPDDQTYSDMVSVYESDFGVCRVILSRWVPTDTVLLLDSSRISVMPLSGRSFHYKPLASTDESVSGQVIGEYTLELKNENAHGLIKGLSV